MTLKAILDVPSIELNGSSDVNITSSLTLLTDVNTGLGFYLLAYLINGKLFMYKIASSQHVEAIKRSKKVLEEGNL